LIPAIHKHTHTYTHEKFSKTGDVVVHTCKPRTQKAEAGELLVQGQPGLYRKEDGWINGWMKEGRKEGPVSA
jgi:hypothetical protein